MPPHTRRAPTQGWPQTLAALLSPRRMVPALVVMASLVGTEWLATRRTDATLVLLSFCTVFLLVIPASARWASAGTSTRYALYLSLCAALVFLATWAGPALLGYESYVAHLPAAPAILVLVAIAGWILARDIDLSGGLREAEERGETLQREAETARLLAIRNHLDPHFLFNTLGAIAEWCREDPLVAERALLELSSMLRTFFRGLAEPWWPLQHEVDMLLALHRLYTLRDDERYRLESTLDLPDGLEVPPLLLLPLFENALTHGAPGAPMHLDIGRQADELRILIWNAGPFEGRRAGGTGIETTERRLELSYGRRATLDIRADLRDEVEGTATRLTLPMVARTSNGAPP